MAGPVEFTFAQVRFEFWEMLGQSPVLPHWQKVALMAYNRMSPNGHSGFARGELELLVFPDLDLRTGELLSTPKRQNQGG